MYRYNTVGDIRDEFAYLLNSRSFVKDKSGCDVLEIVNASFVFDDSESIFGEVNHNWHEAELRWYESQSLNVNDIEGKIPETWRSVAGHGGWINSNYGWCVWSKANGMQYWNVLNKLLRDPTTRQAEMIYTRPTMWRDSEHLGMKDFICTDSVQYVLRDLGQGERLHAMVRMRSSDVVYGVKGDLFWQRHVLNKLAADAGMKPGLIFWNSGSIHCYKKFFYLVDHFARTREVSIKKSRYRELYPDSALLPE